MMDKMPDIKIKPVVSEEEKYDVMLYFNNLIDLDYEHPFQYGYGINTMLVMEVDAKLIGLCFSSRFYTNEGHEDTGNCNVYIKKEYRKLGLGRLLFRELIQQIQEKKIIASFYSHQHNTKVFLEKEKFAKIREMNNIHIASNNDKVDSKDILLYEYRSSK